MQIRIRDVYIKANFPMSFSDKSCSASEFCTSKETQNHIYSCNYLSPTNQLCFNDIKYEQIFTNRIHEQETVAEIFFKRFQRLKEVKSSRNHAGRPGDQRRISLGIKEARRRNKTNTAMQKAQPRYS